MFVKFVWKSIICKLFFFVFSSLGEFGSGSFPIKNNRIHFTGLIRFCCNFQLEFWNPCVAFGCLKVGPLFWKYYLHPCLVLEATVRRYDH